MGWLVDWLIDEDREEERDDWQTKVDEEVGQ